MSVIAHIGAVPVEELLLPLLGGGAALWPAVRALASRPLKRKELP